MNDYVYLFTVFIAMGAVTAAERLLPFACSSWLRKQRWVGVVGDFLPLAIMVLLVLHASTSSALARGGLPVPEAAGVFLQIDFIQFLLDFLFRKCQTHSNNLLYDDFTIDKIDIQENFSLSQRHFMVY